MPYYDYSNERFYIILYLYSKRLIQIYMNQIKKQNIESFNKYLYIHLSISCRIVIIQMKDSISIFIHIEID